MVVYTRTKAKHIGDVTYIWFIGNCLSTDFKPVDKVYDGSKLFEIDTFKSFIYFKSTGWQEISGGSSQDDSSDDQTATGGVTYVHAPGVAAYLMFNIVSEDQDVQLDHTFAEIREAINNGQVILTDSITYDDIPEEMKPTFPIGFDMTIFAIQARISSTLDTYMVQFIEFSGKPINVVTFGTLDEDSYPILVIDDGGDNPK